MASATIPPVVVANRVMTIGDKQYKPGDPVDVSKLPVHKVSQLLNQRRLRPAATPPGQ